MLEAFDEKAKAIVESTLGGHDVTPAEIQLSVAGRSVRSLAIQD